MNNHTINGPYCPFLFSCFLKRVKHDRLCKGVNKKSSILHEDADRSDVCQNYVYDFANLSIWWATWHGLTLVPAWMSDVCAVKCGMIYLSIPILKHFNHPRLKWISNFIPHFMVVIIINHAENKVINHISKRDPGCPISSQCRPNHVQIS